VTVSASDSIDTSVEPAPDGRGQWLKSRQWTISVAVGVMLVTMIPYLIGQSLAHGRQFMWLGYNLDDSCVYLSWMRQAADGATRNLNLFTTDPQHGMAPNLFFWCLGRVAGITRAPLLMVYHAARMICGLALMLLVWELIRALIRSLSAQRLAFLFVSCGAGLGWLPFWWDHVLPTPVDTWQPEAITFLSLYMSPLFCFSMLLQVAMVYFLLAGDRTGRIRCAVYAGMCGFLLGMTHTYDVITMTAVWTAYLLVNSVVGLRQKLPAQAIAMPWLRAVIAGLITLPAVAYIAYQLKTEAVFQARANVATLSPPIYWILLGYGLCLVLAVLGAVAAGRACDPKADESAVANEWTVDCRATAVLIIWAIVNICVAYIPCAFQRKLLQGAHFPIALLAGIGAAWLWKRVDSPTRTTGFTTYALAATVLLCLTNARFLVREINRFQRGVSQTGQHRTYLQQGETEALNWIRANSSKGDAIQPLPWVGRNTADGRTQIFTRDVALMCFAPGMIDREVYCGHWGETPDYNSKLAELNIFESASPRMTDDQRAEFLRSTKVRYLVFSQKRASDDSPESADDANSLLPVFRGKQPPPGYLRLRYSNDDADVYEVVW